MRLNRSAPAIVPAIGQLVLRSKHLAAQHDKVGFAQYVRTQPRIVAVAQEVSRGPML